MPKEMQNFEFDDNKGGYKPINTGRRSTPQRRMPAPQTGQTRRADPAMFGTAANIGKQGLLPTSFEGARQAIPGQMAATGYQTEYINKLRAMQEGLQGRGGGGGGGVKIPGSYDVGQGQGFADYQKKWQEHMGSFMGMENPFGQAGMNVATRDVDLGIQNQLEQIDADFGARGQLNSPAHAAARREVQHLAGLDKSSLIQSMQEKGGQFALARNEVLSNAARIMGDYDVQNRQMVASGQKMADDARRAQSAAARGALNAKMRMSLQLAQMQYGAERGLDLSLTGQYERAWAADRNDYKWGQEFNFTQNEARENRELAAHLGKQQAAAQKSSNIWGTIGKVLGVGASIAFPAIAPAIAPFIGPGTIGRA